MNKKIAIVLFFVLAFGFVGCAGLNFSQLSPDAEDFHPRTIAVLPVTVGEFEPSRDVIGAVVSRRLVESLWYDNVVDEESVKGQIINSDELAGEIGKFMEKLNALGVCDPALAARLRDALHADALILTHVTSWGHGRVEGEKVARVGLGLKLVDASRGSIMWKANHQLVEDYWMIKPKLSETADELMGLLLEEMPH